MRALTLSATAAALVLLAAGSAVAGDPRGGGHHGGPCCAPPPPPPPPCCNHGGGSRNVNINVNASARAFAEASATSHFNARAYDVGSIRARGFGGGTVYVGGGYGGDMAYGYSGAPVYYDIDRRVMACASAPFGYLVTGFGREGRQPPSCGAYVEHEDYGYDRGGRYGYSERHDSYEARSYESYESYEEYGAYEAYEEAGAYSDHDRYRERDCDCRERAPYPPPYLPEPPRYEPPAPPARPHRPRRPRHDAPPRQQYRQEPGERG
ncbi:hypothetical protein [Brevundimonas sp.]|uniref:hypothetical protein n=1 Tax=Brevundimonas sp. TaxID=1871086 RepID=UPI002D5B371A|nr:hypothetical protein [Brevundimonas sp.]HYC68463.1 hypothetical protein [Brevundimonas sp.]